MTQGFTATLAAFAAGLEARALPPEVAEAAGTSLIDQIGAILAAAGLAPETAPFVARARAAGPGRAVVLGHGFTAPAEAAAFANGAMAHAVDYEDTHDATLVHPGAAVVPAALAVAQETGAAGAELLAALVAGAEVTCRVALAFRGNPQEGTGFYILPMIGAFGAAAAAGRLLRLNPAAMEQAFSLAFVQVGGSIAAMEHGPSHLRAVRDAFTARAGVVAAGLAAAGTEGFPALFERRAGYFELFAPGRFDPAAGLAGLGTRFEAARVSLKPWPSCRGTHAFVEAALELRAAHGIAAEQVEAAEVGVSPFFESLLVPAEARRRPASAIAARFSIPFCLGLALARGEVGLTGFDAAARTDPMVLRIADRVRHRVEPWPQAEATRGTLRLHLAGGRVVAREVLRPLGHPDRPMPPERLAAKLADCAARAPVPPDPARLAAAVAAARGLAGLARVDALAL